VLVIEEITNNVKQFRFDMCFKKKCQVLHMILQITHSNLKGKEGHTNSNNRRTNSIFNGNELSDYLKTFSRRYYRVEMCFSILKIRGNRNWVL
jgi:hypothetical protein